MYHMKRGDNKRKNFWEKEYKKGPVRGVERKYLALSDEPSEDFLKFLRFLEREYNTAYLNKKTSVLDLGCGNGRNLIHLAKTYSASGIGYDTSREALAQAKEKSDGLHIQYEMRSIAGDLTLPDESQTMVLDMMASHYLNKEDRAFLRKEAARVLKPDGWLFLKTFLREEDKNAEELLREYPAGEAGSYIHPKIGVPEHVFWEDEIIAELDPHFIIHKILKSHRHLSRGRAFKRRSISIYAQKK